MQLKNIKKNINDCKKMGEINNKIFELAYCLSKKAKSDRGNFEYYYNWKNSCLNYLLHLGLIKKTGFHFFTYSNSYMAYYEGNGYGFHDGVMVKSINSESLGTIDGLISEHSNIELDANFFDIVKDYLNDSDPKMKIDNCNGYYSWIHTSGETK